MSRTSSGIYNWLIISKAYSDFATEEDMEKTMALAREIIKPKHMREITWGPDLNIGMGRPAKRPNGQPGPGYDGSGAGLWGLRILLVTGPGPMMRLTSHVHAAKISQSLIYKTGSSGWTSENGFKRLKNRNDIFILCYAYPKVWNFVWPRLQHGRNVPELLY